MTQGAILKPDGAELRRTAHATLIKEGFSPWGKDGWIRDDEGGGTCYDTPWALSEAGHSDLARELEAAMEREAQAARPADPWEDPGYGKVTEIENIGDGTVCMVFGNGDRRTFAVGDLGFRDDCTFSLDEDDEIIVDDVDYQVALDWLSVRSLTDPMFAAYLRERDEEEAIKVGEGLKRIRERRKLGLPGAARLSGLTEARIAELEEGLEAYGLSEIKSLLRAYMADWNDLVPEHDAPVTIEMARAAQTSEQARRLSALPEVNGIGIGKTGEDFVLRINVTGPLDDAPEEIEGVPLEIIPAGPVSAA